MRYASLALRRDVLRVGCNQFQRNKFHVCDRVARLIKVGKGLLLWRLRGVDCLLPDYVL